MKKVSLSKILSLLFLSVFISLSVSCNNNIDDEPKAAPAIEIKLPSETTSATIGEIAEISVSFSNFSVAPETVDIFVEGVDTPIKEASSVKDGKISIDTTGFEAGTYKLYVKSGTVKSNSLSVVLVENNLLPVPEGVTVSASTTKNKVTVKWTDNGSAKYWIYYNTENNTATAICETKFADSYECTYGYNISLPSSGIYYFWVKSADGYYTDSNTSDFSEAVSFEFTYSSLEVPTGVTVSASTTKNKVTVKWTDNGSAKYWIYYNTENNTATATCETKFADSYECTYGYDISLPSSGTYYFWVKSADGYDTDSNTSDFSEAVSFEFTYSPLEAPTGVTVSASTTKNNVTVKWTNNGSAKYWIYYNTENNTETATCATRSADSLSCTYGYDISLPSSGTYYFWVKSADGYDTDSNTSDFSEVVTYIN